MEDRSFECRFIGYPSNSTGYIFYHREQQKVVVSKHATFLEREFLVKEAQSTQVELDECPDGEPTNEEIMETVGETEMMVQEPVRKSTRVIRLPDRYYGFLVDGGIEDSIMMDDDPVSYDEAIQSKDSGKWLDAMNSEIESMHINKVWTLEDVPKGSNHIGCKWIFKNKIGADGKIETYKARMVAKGYRQILVIDYDKTFSPVAMHKSIRIMLAIAAFYDYEIWQMDVKTAFLNDDLEEQIYMT